MHELQTKLAETQLVQLAYKLGVEVKDLVNSGHLDFYIKFNRIDSATYDLLTTMKKN